MEAFLMALITKAPDIAAAILAATVRKGVLTAEEAADYIMSWPTAQSFFKKKEAPGA